MDTKLSINLVLEEAGQRTYMHLQNYHDGLEKEFKAAMDSFVEKFDLGAFIQPEVERLVKDVVRKALSNWSLESSLQKKLQEHVEVTMNEYIRKIANEIHKSIFKTDTQ